MGYNMLSVASHYLNRDTAGRGRGWDTPRLWPLDRDEFARLEGILNDLLRRGIMVFPFAGFFGRDAFYPNSHREQLKYVRYTMARLGVYRNMLLNVAGPEPLLSVNPFMPKPEVDRLGRLIAEHNAFGLMMSVHNQTGRDAFIDEEYVDYGTLQGPKTLDRRLLHSELMASRRPGKPLYAQETLWPGNGYHVVYGTDDVRRNAIVINMSATALNLADNDGDSSSGFTGTLDTGDAHMEWHTAARGVWDFLETLPFFRMSPHPEMVDRGFCLAEPGVRCLVYLEEGGSVRVNTGKGTYRGVWVNARDTGERIDAGTVSPGSELNVPDGLDWFLLLEHD